MLTQYLIMKVEQPEMNLKERDEYITDLKNQVSCYKTRPLGLV